MKHLLIFCPLSIGGVAKNTGEQAKAIAGQGVKVSLLCPNDWEDDDDRVENLSIWKSLHPAPKSGSHSKLKSRLLLVRSILGNIQILISTIREHGHTHILFSTYLEYLAPIWAWRLRKLRRQGVIFGSMILDPVRDHQVGPAWWHQFSISEGYSFISEAFVHQEITLNTNRSMPQLTTTVVPHGPYFYPCPSTSRGEIRGKLGIPENSDVFLSFGHLRDNKNLDLVLDAIAKTTDVHLLVSGSEASPGQKQSNYYRALAEKLGINERVHWAIEYISDDKVMNYFLACDYVIMAYADSFRSTSGILHIAAPLKIPILVSCGPSPLGSLVEDYNLGLRFKLVGPDSISHAIDSIRKSDRSMKSDEFEKDHSYERNAEIVIERMWAD